MLSHHRSIGQRDALMNPRGTHSRAADAHLERHTQHEEPSEPIPRKNCVQSTRSLRPRVSDPLYTCV